MALVKIGRVIWPGPVGIGAGVIKGQMPFLKTMEQADSVEVGSITREVQHGNEGKTVWRYPEEKGLRHNAGMPNPGAKGIVEQLSGVQYKLKIPWGINVAVSPGIADTTQAAADIKQTLEIIFKGGLEPHWVTVNVSSPDTQDKVEMLAEPSRVEAILKAVNGMVSLYKPVPVWLKVSQMVADEVTLELAQLAIKNHIETMVIANTMPDPKGEPGGWGGRPVKARTLSKVWMVKRAVKEAMAIVGVGGVLSGKDVNDYVRAGAQAVQVVSGLLFLGPQAPQTIRREYELLRAREAERRIG